MPSLTFKDTVFCDFSGKELKFDTIEEAQKALDIEFLKNEYIVPILLGEVDGNCYFISYLR